MGLWVNKMIAIVLAFTKKSGLIFLQSISDKNPWLMERAYPRLTSREPGQFWTSGQWMTEKRGGSDVGM